MKEKILKLRSEGRSYNEIKKILNCSKSTISYYCGEDQKEKSLERTKKYRTNDYLIRKVDNWGRNKFKLGVRNFKGGRKDPHLKKKDEKFFTYKDVIDKFGYDVVCYLSGEKFNLVKDNNYALDHKIPRSRGGSNHLDNLGILHRTVNQMKGNLMKEEFIEWCVKILRYNGYKIKGDGDKRAK